MDTWHDGAVVLIGDSAWCASPLSGLGAPLVLRGAAELTRTLRSAGARENTSRIPVALADFEQTTRPRCAAAQQLPPGRVAAAAPSSNLGIRVNTWVVRTVQSRVLRPFMDRAFAEHGR